MKKSMNDLLVDSLITNYGFYEKRIVRDYHKIKPKIYWHQTFNNSIWLPNLKRLLVTVFVESLLHITEREQSQKQYYIYQDS